MSMWLNLAKIPPALVQEIRARPELLEALFSDEGGLSGFDPAKDVFGYGYRLLDEIVSGRAEAEGEAEWRTAYRWMAEATGEAGEELAGDDVGYGPAFLLDPSRVAQVAAGLMGEGWGFKSGTRTEDFEDFDDLGPFFAAAAREGRAVVGAIA